MAKEVEEPSTELSSKYFCRSGYSYRCFNIATTDGSGTQGRPVKIEQSWAHWSFRVGKKWDESVLKQVLGIERGRVDDFTINMD